VNAPSPFPVLRTDRLVLRQLCEADAPDIARLCADRQIAAGTLMIPHPYTLEDAHAWLALDRGWFEAGTSLVWGIAEGGALVGTIDLRPECAHSRAEMGYWIGVPFWGRSYATEAARRVLEHAFTGAGLNRVFAAPFLWNTASHRVLEKIGMNARACCASISSDGTGTRTRCSTG
jgi:ribosomal-protein-alanine N-acetyltransferase